MLRGFYMGICLYYHSSIIINGYLSVIAIMDSPNITKTALRYLPRKFENAAQGSYILSGAEGSIISLI